jgi:hypothetical protein
MAAVAEQAASTAATMVSFFMLTFLMNEEKSFVLKFIGCPNHHRSFEVDQTSQREAAPSSLSLVHVNHVRQRSTLCALHNRRKIAVVAALWFIV